MHKLTRICFLVCFLFLPTLLIAQTKITAAEAKKQVGAKATVCGNVVSTHYAARTKGSPTFLNLDYKGVPEVVADQPSQIEIQK